MTSQHIAAVPPLRSCPADIDNDGMVGITDFLLVLSQWGPCP